MRRRTPRASASVAAAALLALFAGCAQEEGPAERAGKKIDRALEEARERTEEFGEDVDARARDAARRLEEAAEEFETQLEEASRRFENAARAFREEWDEAEESRPEQR